MQMSDGGSQTSGSSVKPPSSSTDSAAVFDDFDIDSVPVIVPPTRGSGDAFTRTLSLTSDTSSVVRTKLLVKKELKPVRYYTCVLLELIINFFILLMLLFIQLVM